VLGSLTDASVPSARALEGRLARLSAEEIVAALGLTGAPPAVRSMIRMSFTTVSAPLGRVLARFDTRIGTLGLAAAAATTLAELGASWTREGEPPPASGPLLVVANHPGAYDALVLLAALGRDDAAIVATDRRLLRAMPSLALRLMFVPEAPSAPAVQRAHGLRRALRHLATGGAVVHFGAGRIEPDPAFPGDHEGPLLAPWKHGTGALVRSAGRTGGAVVVAIVEGVHSPRAKRLLVTRLVERRGLTTFAPLLQVALRRYRCVEATARFAPATQARELARDGDDASITSRVRDRAFALLPRVPRP
jgi:hypothetical protein